LDEVGGNVPSARISALNDIGLDILEEKIVQTANKMNLFEDMDC